jgi:hypothetical protein
MNLLKCLKIVWNKIPLSDYWRWELTSFILKPVLPFMKGKERVFCSNCASPIYSAKDQLSNVKRLRVGTIETNFTCDNQYHIFAGDKASWHTITDNFPQHKAFKS